MKKDIQKKKVGVVVFGHVIYTQKPKKHKNAGVFACVLYIVLRENY